jgi:hypothetical protein
MVIERQYRSDWGVRKDCEQIMTEESRCEREQVDKGRQSKEKDAVERNRM